MPGPPGRMERTTMNAGTPNLSKVLTALLAATVALGGLPIASAHNADLPTQTGGHGDGVDDTDASGWNLVQGFSSKTGFRLVFTWDVDTPIAAQVNWGYSEDDLSNVVLPLGDVVDTAGIAIMDIEPALVDSEANIYFQVVDQNDPTNESPIEFFPMGNAWNSQVSDDGIYEIDALMVLDTEGSPEEVPDLSLDEMARAVDVFAERVWDMTDGYVRIGKVLITDTVLNYPNNIPNPIVPPVFPLTEIPVGGVPPSATCVANSGQPTTVETPAGAVNVEHTPADFMVETTFPFDSHTWGGGVPVIADPCTAFYIGRVGQLITPWENDLHMGYVMTHEFGHYALGLADLYNAGGNCQAGITEPPGGKNYDISVMHNAGGWNGVRWVQTELDRVSTPCPRSGGIGSV
ncbi:MAG TPA: hypothetical protein VI796_03660, partial [Candidatus Thermoplasmatota archaeon]|nr:hypothetical protein [Candidatus Thermoplasmatota archaeon]